MLGKLIGILLVNSAIVSLSADDTDWAYLVETAGKLGKYNQLAVKYYLFVAKGIKSDLSKEKMVNSTKSFDNYLNDLKAGNSKGILPAANISLKAHESLAALDKLWKPAKEFMLVNVGAIANMNLNDQTKNLKALEDKSYALQKETVAVMDAYVGAGKDHNIELAELLRIRHSSDQLAKVGVLTKDVVLIAMGIDKLDALVADIQQYTDVHNLLLDGDMLLGLPPLADVCKLYSMREVTYHWEMYAIVVEHVLQARTREERMKKAELELDIVVEESDLLDTYLEKAVHLFVEDFGTCVPTEGIKEFQWARLVNLINDVETQSEMAVSCFANIAAGVKLTESRVDLTLSLESTSTALKQLLQGQKSAKIPSPISQDVATALANVKEVFDSILFDLRTAVVRNKLPKITVEKVAQVSRDLYAKQKTVAAMLVAAAVKEAPGMEATVMNIAADQRTTVQKMSKEAMLVSLEIDVEMNRGYFEESAKKWRKSRKTLLEGDEGQTRGNATSAVRKTTNVCIIRIMQDTFDSYEAFEDAAFEVVHNGTGPEILYSLVQVATEQMTVAAEAYANRGNQTCEQTKVLSEGEVKAALHKVAQLRVLTQRVQKEALLVGTSLGKELNLTSDEISTCIEDLKFGSTASGIIAGPTDAVLNTAFVTEASWILLRNDLNKSTKALTTAALSNEKADETLDFADELMGVYVNLAKDIVSAEVLPAERMDIASRQSMLVEKMAKEALISSYSSASSRQEQASASLISTIEIYEATHTELLSGTHSQRTELLSKMADVEIAWAVYKEKLLIVAGGNSKLEILTELQTALDAVLSALENTFILFEKVVPFVRHIVQPWVFPVQVCVPLAILCLPGLAGGISGCIRSKNLQKA